ncbi:MAG TPA: rhomboid family intramembrane serine protease [Stellaceae bacterium]|nr:rhomboid family intramembrane serine protease [Stellaceae bacterium]
MTDRPSAPHQPMFNLPPMTRALLVANLVVFAVMWLLPDDAADTVVALLGFTPARYGAAGVALWPAIVDPVSYQFIHGGFAHIGANMLGLLAFGAGVEQRLGRWRFLAFYLLCGVAGAFTEYAAGPGSAEVMIGASAAISGLFGAILRFRAFRRGFWLLVVLWFLINAVTGVVGVGSEVEPVAWVAHIGGFIAGLLLYPLFVRREFAGQ